MARKEPLETPSLNAMFAEVERLREGAKLLEDVFREHGPYQLDKISDATWMRVQRFFGFDDNE